MNEVVRLETKIISENTNLIAKNAELDIRNDGMLEELKVMRASVELTLVTMDDTKKNITAEYNTKIIGARREIEKNQHEMAKNLTSEV